MGRSNPIVYPRHRIKEVKKMNLALADKIDLILAGVRTIAQVIMVGCLFTIIRNQGRK